MEKSTFDTIVKSLRDHTPVEAQIAWDDIFRHRESDLSPQRGYFVESEADMIFQRALEKLQSRLNHPKTSAEIAQAWNEVCADFHGNQYWGFSPTRGAPPRKPLFKLTSVEKELLPYVWAFAQAAIVMKVVIYYFGIRASHDTTLSNNLFVGFAILFSFGSLFFFAWRHHKKQKNDQNEH